MKAVIVLGSGGYLGNELVKSLLANQYDITVIAVDIHEQEHLNDPRLIRVKMDVTKVEQISKLIKIVQVFCQIENHSLVAMVNALTLNDSRSKRVEEIRKTEYSPQKSDFNEYIEKARESWLEYSPHQFLGHFETNVVGLHNVLTRIYPYAAESSSFVLINISSQFAAFPPNQRMFAELEKFTYKPPGYSASKAALDNYTIYLAGIFKGTKMRAVGLSLGVLYNNHSDKFLEYHTRNSYADRMMKVEEAVGIILWLISDQTAFLNGLIIPAHSSYGN
jgi:NAD(P)-dependent dehydrogenase (short-subunit alcohol dehydrogenase family)